MKYILIAVSLVMASCAFAQQPQPAPQAESPAVITNTSQSGGKLIATVLGEWAKKYDKTLVVEPRLTALVKIDPAAKTFEQGLDLALVPYKNITWRKVYLRAKVEQPKPARLAAMVRTMVSMEATGMIVQDPATSKIGSFVKSVDVPQGYEAGLSKMNPAFAAKVVYVVFDSKPRWASADGLSLLDITADSSFLSANTISPLNIKGIIQKMVEAMKKMNPEDRAKVSKSILEYSDSLDTRTRIGMYAVGKRLMENMTPEERETLRQREHDRGEVMREMGAVRERVYINDVLQ